MSTCSSVAQKKRAMDGTAFDRESVDHWVTGPSKATRGLGCPSRLAGVKRTPILEWLESSGLLHRVESVSDQDERPVSVGRDTPSNTTDLTDSSPATVDSWSGSVRPPPKIARLLKMDVGARLATHLAELPDTRKPALENGHARNGAFNGKRVEMVQNAGFSDTRQRHSLHPVSGCHFDLVTPEKNSIESSATFPVSTPARLRRRLTDAQRRKFEKMCSKTQLQLEKQERNKMRDGFYGNKPTVGSSNEAGNEPAMRKVARSPASQSNRRAKPLASRGKRSANGNDHSVDNHLGQHAKVQRRLCFDHVHDTELIASLSDSDTTLTESETSRSTITYEPEGPPKRRTKEPQNHTNLVVRRGASKRAPVAERKSVRSLVKPRCSRKKRSNLLSDRNPVRESSRTEPFEKRQRSPSDAEKQKSTTVYLGVADDVIQKPHSKRKQDREKDNDEDEDEDGDVPLRNYWPQRDDSSNYPTTVQQHARNATPWNSSRASLTTRWPAHALVGSLSSPTFPNASTAYLPAPLYVRTHLPRSLYNQVYDSNTGLLQQQQQQQPLSSSARGDRVDRHPHVAPTTIHQQSASSPSMATAQSILPETPYKMHDR